MLPVQLIHKKRDGGALDDAEIRAFIAGVTDGSIPDYQIAAMRGPIKFIIPGAKVPPEMYDVVNDPAETRNIIAEHPELARTLEKELRAWLATERE